MTTDTTHANLEAQMGGCPDCNYTVGTILAVTEDRLAQARADSAKYRAALEAVWDVYAPENPQDAEYLADIDNEEEGWIAAQMPYPTLKLVRVALEQI